MKAVEAMRKVRMSVFRPARRRRFCMRWTDPATGRRHEKSTGTQVKSRAYIIASELATKAAVGIATDDVRWSAFVELYERGVESLRAGRAKEPWLTTRRRIEASRKPRRLSELTSVWVSQWQRDMRIEGLAENTVASHSSRLRSALRWAVEQGLLDRAPVVKVRVEEAPRSRAITAREFDCLLLAAEKVRPHDTDKWKRFLRGMWHSGFRISELVSLSWDAGSPIFLDASGKYPLVHLAPKANKSRKRRVRPVTPEFWAIAAETPRSDRHGPVFPLPGKDGQMSVKRVVRAVGKIGREAGIVTGPETGKMATSHDLRRAFTTRLDGRLTLAEIQKWGGWSDMRTVLAYYHTKDAEQLAEKLWSQDKGKSAQAKGGTRRPQAGERKADHGERPASRRAIRDGGVIASGRLYTLSQIARRLRRTTRWVYDTFIKPTDRSTGERLCGVDGLPVPGVAHFKHGGLRLVPGRALIAWCCEHAEAEVE